MKRGQREREREREKEMDVCHTYAERKREEATWDGGRQGGLGRLAEP